MSEATPRRIVNPLNVSRIKKARIACTHIQITAFLTLTSPAGIGLLRVRATPASIFRSEMSFHVHPAPRIKNAPIAHPNPIQRSNALAPFGSAEMASSSPHQQGINKSQVPAGRSARDNLRYGRDHSGQNRSTQFASVASATLPLIPLL
jgi:hypothetical protein